MNIDFTRLKDKSVILLAVSALVQIVSLIVYAATGLTEFTAELSVTVLVCGSLSAVFGIAVLVLILLGVGGDRARKVFDICMYIVYLLGLLAWVFYFTSEVNYLVNIIVAIDGTKLTAAFVFTVLLFLIAWVAALVSAILYRASSKSSEENNNA